MERQAEQAREAADVARAAAERLRARAGEYDALREALLKRSSARGFSAIGVSSGVVETGGARSSWASSFTSQLGCSSEDEDEES